MNTLFILILILLLLFVIVAMAYVIVITFNELLDVVKEIKKKIKERSKNNE